MALTKNQKEYLHDAAYGYVNGYYDEGKREYPPMPLRDLKLYAWETIAWERDVEPMAKAIYFNGKQKTLAIIEELIKADSEFAVVLTDYEYED